MYIKQYKNSLGSGFSVKQSINDKMWSIIVHDHGHEAYQSFKYRAVVKCKAGFLTISEGEGRLDRIATSWKKNALQTLEIQNEHGNYETALAMKGGKIYIVEKAILESLTVGDVHTSFPKMADYDHWNCIGSKTWADPAYGTLVDSHANLVMA